MEIPAGTRMMEGYVAAQGGKYVGQGKQIFISKPWDIPGVKEGVTKIGHWSGNSKSFSYIDGALRHLPTLQARGAAKRLTRNRGKNPTKTTARRRTKMWNVARRGQH